MAGGFFGPIPQAGVTQPPPTPAPPIPPSTAALAAAGQLYGNIQAPNQPAAATPSYGEGSMAAALGGAYDRSNAVVQGLFNRFGVPQAVADTKRDFSQGDYARGVGDAVRTLGTSAGATGVTALGAVPAAAISTVGPVAANILQGVVGAGRAAAASAPGGQAATQAIASPAPAGSAPLAAGQPAITYTPGARDMGGPSFEDYKKMYPGVVDRADAAAGVPAGYTAALAPGTPQQKAVAMSGGTAGPDALNQAIMNTSAFKMNALLSAIHPFQAEGPQRDLQTLAHAQYAQSLMSIDPKASQEARNKAIADAQANLAAQLRPLVPGVAAAQALYGAPQQ